MRIVKRSVKHWGAYLGAGTGTCLWKAGHPAGTS